jgi:F-type H+-transporting ATPase subunit delta
VREGIAAARYARAAFDAARKAGAVEAVGEDLADLAKALKASGLETALESPHYAPELKARIVARVGERCRSPVTAELLKLALRKSRIGILPGVAVHYAALCLEAENVALADVTTAGAPTAPFRGKLEAALGRITGRKLRLRYREDPALVGGFLVKIKNDLIDASVLNRLLALKRRLLETKVN